jgi:hypothetical protein
MTSAPWTLAPAGVLTGALLMWAFRRIADGEALRQAANRIQAHLLEFWLFVDEPSLVWKSWKGLLAANVRFLRLLILPLIILSIPTTPLFFWLDALYGSEPLPVGKPALVTVRFNEPLERLAQVPELMPPEGISIDGPPVRVFSEREVSWRIQPQRPLSGELEWRLAGARFEKSVSAGPDPGFVSRRRSRSLLALVRYPTEAPLGAGPVDWIEVSYPFSSVSLFGFETHWSIWFLAFTFVGAVLSPRRLE